MTETPLESYQKRYGETEKALMKRNTKRWIIAFASVITIPLLPFPYGLIIALSADFIVLVINLRDNEKTHKWISEDINKRYSPVKPQK